MAQSLSDAEIKLALENCASEPIHIPGTVQPFACLLAVTPETGEVKYVSENVADILDVTPEDLLGQELRDCLGSDLWHDIRNARAMREFHTGAVSIGDQPILEKHCSSRAFASDGLIVIEIEPAVKRSGAGVNDVSPLGTMIRRLQSCTNPQALFDLTVDMLRLITGYDRTTIYMFGPDWTGTAVAESKRSSLESWKGLRFPASDIPKQARDIMLRLPLRLIEDADRVPSPIRAADSTCHPLDISLAVSRGVAPVHLQYLRNMGFAASQTLSIVIQGELRGIIAFHSTLPKVPSVDMREDLQVFLPFFAEKLQLLEQDSKLDNVKSVIQLNEDLISLVNAVEDIDGALPAIGPPILAAMNAIGFAIVLGDTWKHFGVVPGSACLDMLMAWVETADDQTLTIDNLPSVVSLDERSLNGCAGALVTKMEANQTLMVFREEVAQTIEWAGAPDKQIEMIEGNLRLQPRGSFSLYREVMKGRSIHWSEGDIYVAKRFLPVISSASQKVEMAIQRQQTLLIGELNHRVRNILALVRSVTRQATMNMTSIDSFSKALDARIQALATAHDLTSHAFQAAASIKEIIRQELEPFSGSDLHKVRLQGPDGFLLAEAAPIFSLIIHELTTNSAKYGSLSVEGGAVDLELTKQEDGMLVRWREVGGPKVVEPKSKGFGSTLIGQAAAYQFKGKSELEFHPDGVRAEVFLPASILDVVAPKIRLEPMVVPALAQADRFDASAVSGTVLLLEDNYIIASDTAELIEGLGFETVEIVASVEDALDFVANTKPVFAVLDVNLGRDVTSAQVAIELRKRGVPFVFATGYDEVSMVVPELEQIPIVKKPLVLNELERHLHRVFGDL